MRGKLEQQMWLIACCELRTQAGIWGLCVHFVYSYLIGFIQMQFSASPSVFLCVMTQNQTLMWCSNFPPDTQVCIFIISVIAELTILSFPTCVPFDPVPSSHLVKVHQVLPYRGWCPLQVPGPEQAFAVLLVWSPDSLGIWGKLSNCDYVVVLLETKPTSDSLASLAFLCQASGL